MIFTFRPYHIAGPIATPLNILVVLIIKYMVARHEKTVPLINQFAEAS